MLIQNYSFFLLKFDANGAHTYYPGFFAQPYIFFAEVGRKNTLYLVCNGGAQVEQGFKKSSSEKKQ